MSSTFDRARKQTLMSSTGPGLTTGANFTLLIHKAFQKFDLLIIDGLCLFGTKLAHPWSTGKTTPIASSSSIGLIV
jgi:hypothetical protein